jgi:hypothetical protein
MTTKNNLTAQPIHPAPLGKRMLLGAGIALLLIVIFLSQVGQPNPEWPKFWMVRPLVIVPLAGAMGGAFHYFMDHLRQQGGWKRILANVLTVIVCLFILWLGTIFGLDGTLWN